MRQQLITIVVGVWLTTAPAAIGFGGPARALHEIAGPLVTACAILATFDLGRPLRWANIHMAILFAALAVVPPFVSGLAALNALAAAAAVVTLAVRTPAASVVPYGGGWRGIWSEPAGCCSKEP